MNRSASRIYSAVWWGAILLLALQISLVSALRYLTGSEPAPEPILANAFATPFLVLHVIGSMAALLIGPLQFVTAIRTRSPRIHRALGWTYVIACGLGAPTGFVLALGTSAGPLAGVPFATAAIAWPVFTWLAIRAAVQGRTQDHRRWMIRSYAVVAGAITLRLMLPAAMISGFEFYPAYRAISWLNWVTNLALAELWIRRNRSSPAGGAALVNA